MISELPLIVSLVLFFALLFAGMKVPFAIAIPGVVYVALNDGFNFLRSLGLVAWGSMNSYTLTAVPLFILLAEIVLLSGMGVRVYRGFSYLLGRLPGGLLQTNIVGCGIFSSISGSSVATAAAMANVSVPELRRRNYDWRLSLGSLAAGGTLGTLIPPSIIMIIYASFTETSVSQLFMAGVIPGIVLMLMFMAYIGIVSTLRAGTTGPRPDEKGLVTDYPFRTLMGDLAPFSLLIFVTLGTIYAGIATPTEAAAVACVASVVIGRIWGTLEISHLRDALQNTVEVVGNILLIVLAAYIYSYAMSISGAGGVIANWIGSLGLSQLEFILMLMLMYLVLGTFLDSLGMVILTVPVLYPILIAYDIDLIWFGIFLVVMIEIGLITPPVGMILFVVQGITKSSLRDVFLGALPFVAVMIAFTLLLIVLPEIALWLPGQMK